MNAPFEVERNRYVYVRPDGTRSGLPWPGHTDSIIEALRAHGDGAKPQERRKGRDGFEHVALELPAVPTKGQPRWHGTLNSYLIDRGLETGLLIRDDDGALSLNHDMADLYDEWERWTAQRRREANANFEMARDWERGKASSWS